MLRQQHISALNSDNFSYYIFKRLIYNLQPNTKIVENMSRSLVLQFFDVGPTLHFYMQRM